MLESCGFRNVEGAARLKFRFVCASAPPGRRFAADFEFCLCEFVVCVAQEN